MTSVRCLICSMWMLLCFPSAAHVQKCTEVNQRETISHHHIHKGQSNNISCNYRKNRSEGLIVSLRTNQRLCEYSYSNTNWTETVCNDDNIRFVWIPETEEISFQLLNLQLNNSGVYTCTVEHIFPPPTRCLGQERIFIHVTAPPSVSVSCVNGSDGVPMMLCASEGFYPDDLKQAWLQDGEYNNNTNISRRHKKNLNSSHVSWNYKNNTDGSYSFTSYLLPSSDTAVFYCWVNHSTLSEPITAKISPTECTEKAAPDKLSVIGIICGVMVVAGLILAGCCRCFRNIIYSKTPVEVHQLPESGSHSTPENPRNHRPASQVYSTLGHPQSVPHTYAMLENQHVQIYSALGTHRPVPCRNNSSDSTSPSL